MSTKNLDALEQIEQLEAAHSAAKARQTEIAREHTAAQGRLQALHGDRGRLIHGEPGLVDHAGQPLASIKDNPVAAIDAELAELPDVDDLYAQYLHARQVTEREERRVREFARDNAAAILEAMGPAGDAEQARVNDALAALRAAVDSYLRFAQRVEQLSPGVRTRGLDASADLARSLQGRELPPPTEAL